MFSSRKSAAPAAAGGYTIAKSLRFRSSASAYLNRTFGTPTNANKFTFSFWAKRGKLGSAQTIFSVSNTDYIQFNASDNIQIVIGNSVCLTTSAVYRDPSAWYHFVFSFDNSASPKWNFYVNSVNGGTGTLGSATFNTAVAHYIANTITGGGYFDGYMAEINFIDGQTLTPSSFGSTNAATNVWQPIKYTGTYGTNGFYLKFTDTTSTSTLGNDSSGNSNTWTVNNISLTSGSTYDSMTDVPTNTSATVANYPVLNPLSAGSSTSITNGNLTYANTGTTACNMYSTMGMTTGKFYCEVTITTNQFSLIGISDANIAATSGFYQGSRGYGYYGSNGNKYNNNTNSSYGATFTNGDVMGIAFDADAGTLTFYKNNVSQGTAYTGIPAGTYFFAQGNQTSTLGGSFNFGQQPFVYTPPSSFVALNTFNLPTPTIGATASTQANKYMDATTYTGTGTTNNVTNSGSMQPDFVWIKNRSSTNSHQLTDSVRGINNALASDLTIAEYTGNMNAFNTNGFQVTSSSNAVNNSGQTYVGWQWRASNATGVTNTSGSVTSTVSANTTAGFSIATFTKTATTSETIGHGLGVAPSMVIVKTRQSSGYTGWAVYHTSIGVGNYLSLDLTDASTSSSTIWNNTAPTSTVFSMGTAWTATQNMVAYCFAQVAGYSAFGSYTGNGSTDGPFIYTGFRPRFVMWKRTDTTGGWFMVDSTRNTYNVANLWLLANDSIAEQTDAAVDYLSNGFKQRTATGTGSNANGGTYIYAAFAESPFKYANAR